MKHTSKVLYATIMTISVVFALSSVCFAGTAQPVTSSVKDIKAVQVPGGGISLCVDPTVKNFNITKSLSGKVATFTITGQVCNNGPGDWNKPDNALEANFTVYNAYAPQFSYAAGGIAQNIKKTVGTVLKKNQCVSFTQTYTRDKILQWGFANNTATQKQMKLMFEFYVRDAKGLIGVGAQPKALDCNLDNNLLSQTFEMMISIP
jgi:hypothetical protein